MAEINPFSDLSENIQVHLLPMLPYSKPCFGQNWDVVFILCVLNLVYWTPRYNGPSDEE